MNGDSPSDGGKRPAVPDLSRARRIAEYPDLHPAGAVRCAVAMLMMYGDQRDFDRATHLRKAMDMDGADDARLPIAWAAFFAFVAGILAFIVGAGAAWLIWHLLPGIDWQPVLRFIAPTAFETRPLELLLGGRGQ